MCRWATIGPPLSPGRIIRSFLWRDGDATYFAGEVIFNLSSHLPLSPKFFAWLGRYVTKQRWAAGENVIKCPLYLCQGTGHSPVLWVITPLIACLSFLLYLVFPPAITDNINYVIIKYALLLKCDFFGLTASFLCTSGIIIWYYLWALNERKFRKSRYASLNFGKPMVAVKLLPQSPYFLSHSFREVTFCCPDKRTQLLSFKEIWWHVTLWYTQLHMFRCPREGTGMLAILHMFLDVEVHEL